MEEKYNYEALPHTRNQNPAQGFGLEHRHRRRGFRPSRAVKFIALACLALIVFSQWKQIQRAESAAPKLSRTKLQADLRTCNKLRTKPTDPIGFGRDRNARYIDGQKPTLIKNATVWVGEPKQGTSEADAREGKGWEWITSDIFVEHGLIKQVAPRISATSLPSDTVTYDAAGRQVTTGIIDMHSHAGIESLPGLEGNSDGNEVGDNITPWARSLDGFKPLDPQIQTIKSGGVTTSLVLPGSGNSIGGEAFVFKFAAGKPDGREELSAADMLADPDRNWRYMKMACGENAKRVHGGIDKLPTSRMGESYQFRRAFEKARQVIREQDDWCDKAEALGVDSMDTYLPQDIEWETLGAALRGQVHINIHCYTVADLEAMVDHTNEFEFPVRAFHHAHETFLVPEILKRTWGGRAPASALFADNMYYKAESYLGSIYAGKHLYSSGLTPVYVSDNPVLNAQHVVFEAAKAFRWGLPYHAALASVTTAPAELIGMGKRLGKIKPGYDADIVVWDSDPLSIGATPAQVWIDGTAQYDNPVVLDKKPSRPILEKHASVDVVETPIDVPDMVFTGITNVWIPGFEESAGTDGKTLNVAVNDGTITCVGTCASELAAASSRKGKVVAVHDGHLTHTFTAVSGGLGIQEIAGESSTGNGNAKAFSRAVDGLLLQGKLLNTAHESGFTKAISATSGGAPSTSVVFLTGAVVAAHNGAVLAEDAALHYKLNLEARESTSYSQLFGELRSKLLGAIKANASDVDKFSEEFYLKRVVDGHVALVAYIDSADGISTLLRVKADVEKANSGKPLHVAIHGGAEAHLVAKELATADVGVILSAAQPLGMSWDARRALTGAPLTDGTTATRLHDAGVTVAIGINEGWQSRSLALDVASIHHNSNGKISAREALKLISSNVHKILGIKENTEGHFLVHEGSPVDITSRIIAVSGGTGSVSVFA